MAAGDKERVQLCSMPEMARLYLIYGVATASRALAHCLLEVGLAWRYVERGFRHSIRLIFKVDPMVA